MPALKSLSFLLPFECLHKFICGKRIFSRTQQNLNNELQSIFRIIFRRAVTVFLCYIFYLFQSHFNDLNLLPDSLCRCLIIKFHRLIFRYDEKCQRASCFEAFNFRKLKAYHSDDLENEKTEEITRRLRNICVSYN
jgi:hypothetical protein